MQDDAFDLALGQAALEARDPGLAHWAVGLAERARAKASSLIDSGQLGSFESCLAGISKRRIPPREDAIFRDGTSLVLIRRNEPWEAADLAETALREGAAWICLRLAQRIQGGGASMVWACAKVEQGERLDFDVFWPRCARELARAEVHSVEDLAARGYFKERLRELADLRERARSSMEREGLGREVGQAPAREAPSRL